MTWPSAHKRAKQNRPGAGQLAANNPGDFTAFGPDMRITAMAERPGGVANAKIVSTDVIGTSFVKWEINAKIVVKWNAIHNKNPLTIFSKNTGYFLLGSDALSDDCTRNLQSGV